MKSIKKVFVLLVCITLALNLFLMGGPVKGDYDSNYILPDGSYDDILSFWGNSITASAEQLENEKSSATPGKVNTLYGATTTSSYPSTKMIDRRNFKYYYEGRNYAYGIDGNGKEIISFKQENGQFLDMVDGAGVVQLKSADAKDILVSGAVKDFTEGTDSDGNKTLTVNYNISGTAEKSSYVKVYYTFGSTAITVKYEISAVTKTGNISKTYSKIARQYLRIGERKNYRAQVNSKWIYPDDLDYPYQDFESLVYIDEFQQGVSMYTSLRDEHMTTEQHMVENMDGQQIAFNFTDGSQVDYTTEYTISFADAVAEKQNPDYLGLFRGMKSDFAAGIAPVTPESDNSTVFVGTSVDLNLNVTNLLDEEITFSLRYDIRNYYGDVVDYGLFANNKILSGLDANRTVTVSGKYGIYYLNLYVITENNTYSECYPFALLPDYEYKYTFLNSETTKENANNPFGFASAAAGKNPDGSDYASDFTLSKYEDTANLMIKLGVATVRAGDEPGYIKMMKTLKANGVFKINGGTVANNFDGSDEGIKSFTDGIYNAIKHLKDDDGTYLIDAVEIGNEMSLYALKDKGTATEKKGYIPAEQLYPIFYKYMHQPAYELISEEFPEITYIPTQASACETSWLTRFTASSYTVPNTIDEVNSNYDILSGLTVEPIWNQIKVLTAHIYGSNFMPDVYGCNDANLGRGKYIWNIEAGVQRIYDFLSDNPDENGNQKDFYFTEVGYATPPTSKTSVCLRTQADYIVRIGAICAGYGVDRIQYYQFYDRTSYNSGYDNDDGEYNFGSFYKQDYYGVIKPKPAGIAFAIMTRQLESIKKDGGRICEKYDEGFNVGGVRAFAFDTQLHGDVLVAYSNSEVLSNGRKDVRGVSNVRTPTLPWNNQWHETDPTEFIATGNSVKVVDIMGNETVYTPQNGKVTIPLTGSPVYIYGVDCQ